MEALFSPCKATKRLLRKVRTFWFKVYFFVFWKKFGKWRTNHIFNHLRKKSLKQTKKSCLSFQKSSAKKHATLACFLSFQKMKFSSNFPQSSQKKTQNKFVLLFKQGVECCKRYTRLGLFLMLVKCCATVAFNVNHKRENR